MQVWDAHAALAFLSMCRAYKPLLAAQRQQATLVGILDFLQPLVRQCSTAQLATLLLDLAFIGCQSFKSHPLLSEVSMELYGRLQSGSLTSEHAVELADAIRALDKLDHCHDALSRAAGALPNPDIPPHGSVCPEPQTIWLHVAGSVPRQPDHWIP